MQEIITVPFVIEKLPALYAECADVVQRARRIHIGFVLA